MKKSLLFSCLGFCFCCSSLMGANEAKDYPLNTCVVSGKKLGSMGEPHVFHHEGQEVRLCCESCMKDFNKDPDQYTRKIQAAMPHAMAQNLQGLTGKQLDTAFLTQMIHHHQMGIDMAKLATTNTGRQELNKVGLEMIARQSEEIRAMNQWLEQWQGEKPANQADSPPMMMGHPAELRQARDVAFDRMFIEMMIRHHQGAIQMATKVRDQSDNEILKNFAGKLIDEQSQEITQLENWQKEWFPQSP